MNTTRTASSHPHQQPRRPAPSGGGRGGGEDRVEDYVIAVEQGDLDDLADRLARARWSDSETVDDASQGTPLQRLQEVIAAWREHDWLATQERLNRLPHHLTRIDGLDVHVVHLRSPHPQARPLLLAHGWPGSFLEFEPVLHQLVDPTTSGGDAAQAFHVVLPSMPGFGFGQRPSGPGWGPPRIAAAWLELMDRLGYERFAVHGGDWGSFVGTECAVQAPERVQGLHLTTPVVWPTPEDVREADAAERALLERRDRHMLDGFGFAAIMGSRPQTIGAGLVDSPLALAAWLTEKFDAYADRRPGHGGGVPDGALLDHLALYWLTATGASSSRFYWDAFRSVPTTAEAALAHPVTVPSAFSCFPAEPFPAARRWAEHRYSDIRSWRELDRGGHFPALEQPDLFVDEVRRACALFA